MFLYRERSMSVTSDNDEVFGKPLKLFAKNGTWGLVAKRQGVRTLETRVERVSLINLTCLAPTFVCRMPSKQIKPLDFVSFLFICGFYVDLAFWPRMIKHKI